MRIGNWEIGRPKEEVKVEEKLFDTILGGSIDDLNRTTRLSNEKTISTKLLKANRGWVYRNNDVIAKAVSKMEFELYTIGLSAGEIVYNEVESHPLLDLLDKFNDEMTLPDAMYIIQSHKKLTGDSFVIKLRANGGEVTALRPLPPDKIFLNLRTPTEKDPTAIESYTYKDKIDGQQIQITYQPEDVIHFKTPNPDNPFRGLGAVEALAETIDLDNLTTEVTKKYFTNGAIQNFALSTEAKITADQLKMLKAELKASTQGTQNAFTVPIFGGGLKPIDISYSNKDNEFLGQLEWYRDKIMYGFGNTKSSLGILEDVNRASNESAIVEWQRGTVKPEMQSIVDTLNEFLVPEFGENLVLGFCDPVPEDRSDDVDEIQKLYPIGVLTLNEARAMVKLEEIDGGDQTYQRPTFVTPDEAQDE